MSPFGTMEESLLVFPEHPLVPVHALLDLAADVGDEAVDGHAQQEEAVLDRHEQQDPVALAGPGGEGLNRKRGTHLIDGNNQRYQLFIDDV